MDKNENDEGKNEKVPIHEDEYDLTKPQLTEKQQQILERRIRISDQYGAVPVNKICDEEHIELATYYRDLDWIRKNAAQEWVDEMGKDRLIFNMKGMANQMELERDMLWEEIHTIVDKAKKKEEDPNMVNLTGYFRQLNDTLRLEKEFLGDVPTLYSLKQAVKYIAKGAKGLARQT